MPITIRKIELFVLSCFSLQHLSNVPKMPVFLSFFPKIRHFETGSNCDVLTLKRTSFSTFFVVGRSNHLPITSAFFRQMPSVAIYTKKLEINLTAMSRGFESHRLRQVSLLNSTLGSDFLLPLSPLLRFCHRPDYQRATPFYARSKSDSSYTSHFIKYRFSRFGTNHTSKLP